MAANLAQSTHRINPPHVEPTVAGWYAASGPESSARPLDGDVSCDWLVVGAGWMGIHAARRLAELQPDDSVVLVDAGRIGNNASGRCAGFAIDLAHNPRKSDFVEDVKGNQEELETNLHGIAYLRSAVEDLGVECDWQPQGKYHSAATENGRADLRKFAGALDVMQQTYRWVSKEEIREHTGSGHYIEALFTPGAVLLQPAKYLRNAAARLPANVAVHENTIIAGIEYGSPFHVAETAGGTIRAKGLILCNAGYLTRFGFHEKTAIPVYTYASMTRPLTEAEMYTIGGASSFGLIPANSFGTTVRRTVDHRLFLRNVYAYAENFRSTAADVAKARRHQQIAFDRRWPSISGIGFEHSWGGLLTLSQNGGMIFGQLTKNVFGAAFCNGTGVARGTAFGKAIAEMAVGRSSRIIDILKGRSRPTRAYPTPITHLGVKLVTGHRFRQAGLEV